MQRFVVFEGLDGAGTTTQVALLRDELARGGVAVETSGEPSEGVFGVALRKAIEGHVRLDAVALALGFAADRADHLFKERGVLAALDAGRWVLSDRYVMSSLAYQASLGVDPAWLREINSFAMPPDVTIFIDTPVELCLERIAARGGGIELFEERERLRAVAELYRTLVADERITGHLIAVDGTRPAGEIAREIREKVRALP
jgi:dTMP kinase